MRESYIRVLALDPEDQEVFLDITTAMQEHVVAHSLYNDKLINLLLFGDTYNSHESNAVIFDTAETISGIEKYLTDKVFRREVKEFFSSEYEQSPPPISVFKKFLKLLKVKTQPVYTCLIIR